MIQKWSIGYSVTELDTYREGEQPLQYYSKKLLRERGNLAVIMSSMYDSSAEFHKIHIHVHVYSMAGNFHGG